jgi:putative toxin-antitoxin system antitoxin component (TIGR02293 family)
VGLACADAFGVGRTSVWQRLELELTTHLQLSVGGIHATAFQLLFSRPRLSFWTCAKGPACSSRGSSRSCPLCFSVRYGSKGRLECPLRVSRSRRLTACPCLTHAERSHAADEQTMQGRAPSASTSGTAVSAAREVATGEERVYRDAWQLLGGARIFGRMPISRQDVHEAALAGVPCASLRHLIRTCVALTKSDVGSVLGITVRKVSYYEGTPKLVLPTHLTGLTWMLAEVLAKASCVFGGVEAAQRWLTRPAVGLSGQRPIDMLRTIQGAEVVDDFLARLEYCVYT